MSITDGPDPVGITEDGVFFININQAFILCQLGTGINRNDPTNPKIDRVYISSNAGSITLVDVPAQLIYTYDNTHGSYGPITF